ncbi:hypothetical protein Q9295_06010 [Xinfangfangia sp. CPCC 101601]|uniref:Uncharacterized protein n=1 Tax=Pseudogemmobacter lacusdianii TaxID=3069608 RepID=A0ABU0VVZ3_9RHOB|nr:hypothetical protein [Xinfangfangia sp. CPCC 101601]MDQ2065917.1 hypothetical protein [Xinfangfangia sp. CPCC 101601]
MSVQIQTQRRWLRSVIGASTEPLPALPWAREQRLTSPRASLAPLSTARASAPARKADLRPAARPSTLRLLAKAFGLSPRKAAIAAR